MDLEINKSDNKHEQEINEKSENKDDNNCDNNKNKDLNSIEEKQHKVVDISQVQEIREYDQYFFSEKVLISLVNNLKYEDKIICLCTPALANAFSKEDKETICLDIDKRFEYLKGFTYYNILKPYSLDYIPDLIVFDPPFFNINLVDLYNCVEVLTKGNKSTALVFAFVTREERALLEVFKSYKLKETKFKLEYMNVDPTKWSNYSIYSNKEYNKIQFVNKDKKKK